MRPSGYRSGLPLLVAVVATGLGSGCIRGAAGPSGDLSKPSTPAATFPTPGELAPLPSLPAPPEAFTSGAVPVDRWALEGSVPSPAADESRYDDPSPWGDVARAFAQAHRDSVRLSASLRCAALETARFYAQQRGLPTESLRRFLVARCGATSPDVSLFVYGGDANAAIPDAQIFEQSRGAIEKQLASQPAGGAARVVGIGAYRAEGRFAIAVMSGSDLVTLEPLPRSVDASRHVSIRGRLRGPAADAIALVNQGDYGVSPCLPDPAAHLPSFAFSCALSEQDHVAWAEIVVRQNGRVLEDAVADLLIDDGNGSQPEYRARPATTASTAHPADVRSNLLEAINAVRAQGQLPPLALEAKQSDADGRLAGTLLDATFKHRDPDVDRIALGMLAGWDVAATIRNGGIFVGVVPARVDAGAWVDFALERPIGRSVLLEPEARRVAIAPAVQPEGKGLGAVVTTYSTFDTVDPVADAARVVERVAGMRRALGHQAFGRLPAAPVLDEQSRRVLAGATEPGAALYASMQALAQQAVGGRVHGYLVEGNDVDRLPIPDEILDLPNGSLTVRVTHHRVKGAAWGQYVIFYLVVTGATGTGSVET